MDLTDIKEQLQWLIEQPHSNDNLLMRTRVLENLFSLLLTELEKGKGNDPVGQTMNDHS